MLCSPLPTKRSRSELSQTRHRNEPVFLVGRRRKRRYRSARLWLEIQGHLISPDHKTVRRRDRGSSTKRSEHKSGGAQFLTEIPVLRGIGRHSAAARPRKAVGAPVLAAYSLMNEEQAVRIVPLLRGGQSRIVGAPERVPPVPLEVIAFRQIRSGLGRDL